MRFLRRFIRNVKWRLQWVWDWWPTWEGTMRFPRRFIRKVKQWLQWVRYWWPTWEPVRLTWVRFSGALKRSYIERDFRRWGISLPAILAGVLWLVFAGLLLAWTRERIETQYSKVAKQALASRHYERACLAFERLLNTDRKPDPSHIFGLALSLQGLGQEEEAAALLGSIAPLNASGYVPAHLLIAKYILASPSPNPSVLPTAESHLKWVLLAEPQNIEARLLLGGLYLKTGQWASAREQLQKAYPAGKEAALLLARVAAAQGDGPGAQKWAETAQSVFRAEVTAYPAAVLARARWAEATLMLGQFAEALDILKTGMMQSGDRIYREMASRVCEEWTKKVARESPADLGTQLSLIQSGLEYAPYNRELLMRLVGLSHLSGKEADAARDRLKALLLAGGKDAAMLHFCLGSDAWQHGRLEEARQHFALAYELAPQMPHVANNMAMVLATGDPPDLPRALAIIQSLSDKFPDDPHVLDTRGQILVKMGRWQEGVKCLELALPSLSSKATTRKALAEAYGHLGLKELAEEHQRLAEGK
jgi:tetratricopeptide (TPR) repeat protein